MSKRSTSPHRGAIESRPLANHERSLLPAVRTGRGAMTGRISSAPGRRQQSQRPADVRAQPAAADQDQPLAVVRMLVDELHGHAAAERLTDDRCSGRSQARRASPAATPRMRRGSSRRGAWRIDRVPAGRARRRGISAKAAGSPPAMSRNFPPFRGSAASASGPLPTSRYATRSPCSSMYFISLM